MAKKAKGVRSKRVAPTPTTIVPDNPTNLFKSKAQFVADEKIRKEKARKVKEYAKKIEEDADAETAADLEKAPKSPGNRSAKAKQTSAAKKLAARKQIIDARRGEETEEPEDTNEGK